MTIRGIGLFKELVKAAEYLRRNPRESKARITFNKSRYTLPREKVLEMIRLYLPYIRTYDDQKLLGYLYLHQGVVEKWVTARDKTATEDLAPETLDKIEEAGKLSEPEQEKAIDEAVQSEKDERQRKKVAEGVGSQRVVSPENVRPETQKKTETKDENIGKDQGNNLKDLDSAATKYQIKYLGEKAPKRDARLTTPTITRNSPINTAPVKQTSEKIANEDNALKKPTPPIQASGGRIEFRSEPGVDKSPGLLRPKKFPDQSPVQIGPTRMEAALGRVRTVGTGAGINTLAKNVSSKAQVETKKLGGRVYRGIRSWLPGGTASGSGGGGGRTFWTKRGYVEYGDDGEEVSGRLYGDREAKKSAKIFGLPPLVVILGVLFIGFIGMAMSAGAQPEPPTASPRPSGGPVGFGCPTPEQISANRSSPEMCKYLAPAVDLFDTNISAQTISSFVDKYSPIFVNARIGNENEFKRRANYIVTMSQRAGLNPAVFLGYWKTESNFSTVGGRDMGCAGEDFEEQVACALGMAPFDDPVRNPIANCARSKDADSVACRALKAIRAKPILDGDNPITYPIASLDDFAEAYGSRAPSLDGVGRVNNNCVSTYNKLVEMVIELGACKTSSSNQCVGGWPTTGSLTQGPRGASNHNRQNFSVGRYAVDIGAPTGTPVYANFDGKVVGVCSNTSSCDDRGNYVEIQPTNGSGANENSRIRYLHFSKVADGVSLNSTVSAGQVIGYVGTTGASTGPHLHYDFANFSFAPPNLPQNITPVNCESGGIPCSPARITACTSGVGTQPSAPGSTPQSQGSGEYWFVLNRPMKYELLYQGVPGDINLSTLVKKSTVNPGRPGKDPTPLPQKLGREYWILTGNVDKYEEGTENYQTYGPYFMALDVPYQGSATNSPACRKDNGSSSCFGPVPYLECGASGVTQCDWGTAGQFAIHGNNRLSDSGSAGCVRHNDTDIREIYEKLSQNGSFAGVRYYVIDATVDSEGLTNQVFKGAIE